MSNNDLIVFKGKRPMGKLSSAKERAARMLKSGQISQAEFDKIQAKADKQ